MRFHFPEEILLPEALAFTYMKHLFCCIDSFSNVKIQTKKILPVSNITSTYFVGQYYNVGLMHNVIDV